jgi:hypothetical protein
VEKRGRKKLVARKLKSEEYALLQYLLTHCGHSSLIPELESASVTEMKDGGMGSLRFVHDMPTKLGSVLCEADGFDSDSVPLDISINLDEEGRLYELDIWKVNFAPLLTYPTSATLRRPITQP